MEITLSTNDINNTATLLFCSSIKQWKGINLINCHIQDAGLYILHRKMTSPVTIERLWLYNNDLSSSSDGCLADIVLTCEVKWLAIGYNKTIGQTEEFFPKILSPLSSMIERLYVTSVKLSNRAAIIIFTLLKERKTRLKWLDMANNNVSDDACHIIAETLQVSRTLE